MRLPAATALALLMLVPLSGAAPTALEEAARQRTSGIAACEAIPRRAYETGLLFNPEGLETFYRQSYCFQELAVKVRDAALCERVRQRRSLLFDGSGISPARCGALVSEQISRDLEAAGRIRDVCGIATAEFERNGNGRDFDVHLTPSGSYGHGYEVTIALLSAQGEERVLYSSHHFVGSGTELVLFIPLKDVLQALGGRPLEGSYPVRTRLTLVPSVEEVTAFSFVPDERKVSSIEQRVDFSRLERKILKIAPRR